jgi:hypothetical protein
MASTQKPICFARNDGRHSPVFDCFDKLPRIVGPISDEAFAASLCKKAFSAQYIVSLTGFNLDILGSTA